MIDWFKWLRTRGRAKAVPEFDPSDPALTRSEIRRHFERIRAENIILRDGSKSSFGVMLVKILVDRLRDLEIRTVWTAADQLEYAAIKSERETLLAILGLLGASESRVEEIGRQIEGLGPDED